MKLMSYFIFIFIVLWSSAGADMVLNKSIVYFEPGESNKQDIEIENVGTEPLYVKVEPKIVKQPGTEQQTREPYNDPTKSGLLVSPNKLVIPAGGRKLVRFVNLRPNPTEEHVYRVSISPVIGDLVEGQSGVKIVIGYEVLVLVHAINGEPELFYTRSGKTIEIENKGNRNVLLREGIQCPNEEKNEDSCDHIPGKRLYPRNKWKVVLPHDMPVKFFLNSGSKNSVKIFE
jgi:P pilus assembly chaperone PapD